MYEKYNSHLSAAYLTLENYPHYKIFIPQYRHKVIEITMLAKWSSGKKIKISNATPHFEPRSWPLSSSKLLTYIQAVILRNFHICPLKWRFHWHMEPFIALGCIGFFCFNRAVSSFFSPFFVRWQTAPLLHAGRICLCKSLFCPASASYLLTSVINEPKRQWI